MNLQAMLSPEDAIVCPPSPASSTTSSFSSSSSYVSGNASDSGSKGSPTADALQRGWVAPFLLHLHQMLRRENPKIIRWTDDGYSTYSREHFTRDNYSAMSLVKRQSKKSRKRPASDSAGDETEVKRVAAQPLQTAGERCKPILPRPGFVTMDSPMEAVQGTDSPMVTALPAPVQSFSPPALHWNGSSTGLFVHAPSASSPLFSLPVISPTRKVTGGCKLPSIHDLSFSNALSSNVGARPRWLA
ncbi:hypothetical protein PybrP1_001154 [[Pythium] brassicae (nom. inval.)]|nr:hypothetical protein PybrP1_001154 [[Pythium] brassicae (nom. inval.)]